MQDSAESTVDIPVQPGEIVLPKQPNCSKPGHNIGNGAAMEWESE